MANRYNTCLGVLIGFRECNVYTDGSPHCGGDRCRRSYERLKKEAQRRGDSVSNILATWWAEEAVRSGVIVRSIETLPETGFIIGNAETVFGNETGLEAQVTEAQIAEAHAEDGLWIDSEDGPRFRGFTQGYAEDDPRADAKVLAKARDISAERGIDLAKALMDLPEPRSRRRRGSDTYELGSCRNIAGETGDTLLGVAEPQLRYDPQLPRGNRWVPTRGWVEGDPDRPLRTYEPDDSSYQPSRGWWAALAKERWRTYCLSVGDTDPDLQVKVSTPRKAVTAEPWSPRTGFKDRSQDWVDPQVRQRVRVGCRERELPRYPVTPNLTGRVQPERTPCPSMTDWDRMGDHGQSRWGYPTV